MKNNDFFGVIAFVGKSIGCGWHPDDAVGIIGFA